MINKKEGDRITDAINRALGARKQQKSLKYVLSNMVSTSHMYY